MQDKHHANKTDTYEHLWEINKATVLWVALLYLSNEAKPSLSGEAAGVDKVY